MATSLLEPRDRGTLLFSCVVMGDAGDFVGMFPKKCGMLFSRVDSLLDLPDFTGHYVIAECEAVPGAKPRAQSSLYLRLFPRAFSAG